MGEVEDVEVLALELGYKFGEILSSYLGFPLGTSHGVVVVWDGVEERYRKST